MLWIYICALLFSMYVLCQYIQSCPHLHSGNCMLLKGVVLIGLLFIPVWYFIQQAVTRNILNSKYILMSMFAWGQVFPRSISLNRIYQSVQESDFRAIQSLFHCGFLCQKKAQGPNNRHSEDKGKQRGKLGWATSASFLPLLFSQWFVLCDIFVWVHQVHKYAGWLAGQGVKASVTCCPKFPCPCSG